VFVLLVTAVKEIFEDWVIRSNIALNKIQKRAKSDSEINNRKILVLRNKEFQELLWKQVVVGDIVKVTNDSFFPTDLVILSSSLAAGMCYIQTANLDG
jgi:phospholipid-transporting ATPase